MRPLLGKWESVGGDGDVTCAPYLVPPLLLLVTLVHLFSEGPLSQRAVVLQLSPEILLLGALPGKRCHKKRWKTSRMTHSTRHVV